MKTEQELKEELNDLKSALKLKDKGLVEIRQETHKIILRKIDFLEEVLEEGEKKKK